MCKGMVFWPELSHGDSFAIEYVASNAWEKETVSVAEQVSRYCKARYPKNIASDMETLWQKLMPIVQLNAWCTDGSNNKLEHDLFNRIIDHAKFKKEDSETYRSRLNAHEPYRTSAAEILEKLSGMPTDDEMTRRDIFDIARTVIGRYINAYILEIQMLYATDATVEELTPLMERCEKLLGILVKILGFHEDYSMLDSLEKLKSVTETNPNFEKTLKNNAECWYCRSYIYENAAYLYLPEMKLVFDTVKSCVKTGEEYNSEMTSEGQEEIRKQYFETPLNEMKRDCGSLSENLRGAASLIKNK